jgi:hypothetical protein
MQPPRAARIALAVRSVGNARAPLRAVSGLVLLICKLENFHDGNIGAPLRKLKLKLSRRNAARTKSFVPF